MKHPMPIKKALVIRFRRVGDAVLALSVCTSLKKTFPGIWIDFVLNENIASLFEDHPDIDRVITFDDEENHRLSKYVSKVKQIMRVTHYDVIIDMRATVKTLFFSLFSLSTPFRIGTKKGYNLLLNNYRIDNHKDNSIDMVQHDLMLLAPLEKIAPVNYDPVFRFYVSDEERTVFQNYMKEQGIDFARKIVLVTPATRVQGKNWDMEKMQDVIRKMIDKYHPQIIFNYGGEVEKQQCRELYDKLNCDQHIFFDINAKTLKELKVLISLCDFFFGNEGGPRHIAQALDVPSYAIYPPGVIKSVWLPGNDPRFQGISPDDIKPDEPDEMTREEQLELITVERVWMTLDSMLNTFLN